MNKDFKFIASSSSKPLLVCFSHLRWNFVWQRPQHLLSHAANDYRVLFVEEPAGGAVGKPRFVFSAPLPGVTVAVPILPEGLDDDETLKTLRALVIDLLGARQLAVLWYYTPIALAFSEELKADTVVYDNMDELSLFRGASQTLVELERRLFARADIVFTGGASLYQAKRDRHPSVHCFPSSVDLAHFAAARTPITPDQIDQRAIPRPRLGFFGVIDERMDLDLLRAAADLRPDWSFCMIGPVVKIDPASLPRRANIHWLGQKSYTELPRYLAGWDVGLMNFALNEATRFISPTKTPEFLAAGVPVVSTPIPDVVRPYGDAGLVEIAADGLEVVRKAQALMERPKELWLRSVDRHLAGQSWARTWSAMRALLLERARSQGRGQRSRTGSSLETAVE